MAKKIILLEKNNKNIEEDIYNLSNFYLFYKYIGNSTDKFIKIKVFINWNGANIFILKEVNIIFE